MTSPGDGPFSAADSALGYLYQTRVALLWSLRRMKSRPDFSVSLETLDDVVFESTGADPAELLQTKHHLTRAAALSDASPDLWKSLRVWLEGSRTGAIAPDATLYLLSTSEAPDGSIASRLRPDPRDVETALSTMAAISASSSSTTNAPAYVAFKKTSLRDRQRLVERIFVLDNCPNILDLDDALMAEVFWTVDRGQHDAFLRRLEGWWTRRVIRQLADPTSNGILAAEIEAEMTDLRDQFKPDSLPIDDDLLAFNPDEHTLRDHAQTTFVRQLEIIQASRARIAWAIRDYYRAFQQRSRWIREDLVLVGDLEKYERRLIEEWQLQFEAVRNELGEAAAEDAKRTAARQVLRWAESVSIPIRPAVAEPFVCRGSLHMLADAARIGWHPEFEDRLAALISAGEVQS